MGKTGHLNKSKVAKFDEFYTPREAVDKEIAAYVEADPDVFRGKVVYLPADRATGNTPSAFWEYFKENFLSLGLRKLVATCYKSVPGGDGDPEHGERATLNRSADGVVVETVTLLEGDGDFRSYELHSDFLEADVVVTNPPFSRLKDLLEIVTLLDKEFLLVVPLTSMNYRRTFQLIWKKRAWCGATAIREFLMRNKDGTLTPFAVQTLWFTNIYHKAERKQLAPLRTMAENRERAKGKACEQMLYKRYDNYDAIEVSRLEYIPADYQGKIGVPITVLPYIARPLKGVVTEEARAAHREQKFTPSEWELTWKPKYDPFYVWGLLDTQTTRAPRGGSMRDYWGLTLEGKVMFTRIILQYSPNNGEQHSSPCVGPVGAQHATPSRPVGEECSETRSPMRLRAQGVACCAPTKTMNVAEDGYDGDLHSSPCVGPVGAQHATPSRPVGEETEDRKRYVEYADHLFDLHTHTHTQLLGYRTIIGAANYSTSRQADKREHSSCLDKREMRAEAVSLHGLAIHHSRGVYCAGMSVNHDVAPLAQRNGKKLQKGMMADTGNQGDFVGAQHATPSRPVGEECSETRSPMRLTAQGVACCAPTKTMNVEEDGLPAPVGAQHATPHRPQARHTQ